MAQPNIRNRCITFFIPRRAVHIELQGGKKVYLRGFLVLPLLTSCVCLDTGYEFNRDYLKSVLFHESFPVTPAGGIPPEIEYEDLIVCLEKKLMADEQYSIAPSDLADYLKKDKD